MFEDQEVLHEVWDARIPMEFCLAGDEVSSASHLDTPKPFYMLVPRVSYFPVVWDKVQRFFLAYVSKGDGDEMWLEYDGIPLKWHYPIGVLFDLLTGGKAEENFPWSVTVHFKRFPEDHLLHCRVKETVEAHFMQSLKEADQLKHKGQIVQTMQKRDHKQLWNGILNDRFEQYWSINKRIMENSDVDPIRYVPMRLYMRREGSVDMIPVQKLVSHADEDGTPLLLEHALRTLCPALLESGNMEFISLGAKLDMDTPLIWLCINFAYPDNFVHIVARSSTLDS